MAITAPRRHTRRFRCSGYIFYRPGYLGVVVVPVGGRRWGPLTQVPHLVRASDVARTRHSEHRFQGHRHAPPSAPAPLRYVHCSFGQNVETAGGVACVCVCRLSPIGAVRRKPPELMWGQGGNHRRRAAPQPHDMEPSAPSASGGVWWAAERGKCVLSRKSSRLKERRQTRIYEPPPEPSAWVWAGHLGV
jgi:hypothetical protein